MTRMFSDRMYKISKIILTVLFIPSDFLRSLRPLRFFREAIAASLMAER